MVISTGGSRRGRRSFAISQPTANPTITPPTPTSRNPAAASVTENTPVSTAATATRYTTRPVASLSRLSPSSTVTIARGTRSRLKIAVAATASGGETIAPRVKATGQSRPGTSACATTATTATVARTRPMASEAIGRAWARKSRIEVKNAAMYSSGGRNSRKTSSGASSTSGNPGTRAVMSPPITSTIGYGVPSRRASSASAATSTNSPRTSSMSRMRRSHASEPRGAPSRDERWPAMMRPHL